MQTSTKSSTAKFRHLIAILSTAATLLKVSLQSDVSGYICDDLAVWHDKATEVARLASELLTPADPYYAYPALLEDTKLFGNEDKNLFVVPFRNFGHVRNGGRLGHDRIVMDDVGNVVGVVVDVNNGAHDVPAYKKCTTFWTFENLSLVLNTGKIQKTSGFVCGSNFLGAAVETEMKSKCKGLENLLPTSKEFFQFLDRKGITWSNKKLSYKHFTNIDYNSRRLDRAAIYNVEFSLQCRLIQVKPVFRGAFPRPACLEVWTPKPSVDIIRSIPSLSPQNQNQESSETYHCRDIKFRISTLRNYLNQFHRLLSTTSPIGLGGSLIRQDDKLILWPILSPDRLKKRIRYRTIFAMGFDENKFLGLYYGCARVPTLRYYKPCPYPDLLKPFLEDITFTDRDGQTRDFFF
ncbi:BgTH12-07506 [Blumeria graminis f. sp. triticale]|uniref:BgtE-20097 n=3 Tax=Blumeria graminis TaxID=34373 RepID=A0A9X9PS85_BLUGR|nr:BgTH12-07506 [Blumeria graminis f. sp. triticale]VCU40583.1 BgtE-20097 [Blumeria graminis f. sp. tritici]